jgi:Ubiquitin-2 like Rad60 SUMO-like
VCVCAFSFHFFLKNTNFGEIKQQYCEQRGYPVHKVVFEFDGEELEKGETPNDVDMEDEDLVDVTLLA